MKTYGKFFAWLNNQIGRDDAIGSYARLVSLDRYAPRAEDDPRVWRAYCYKIHVPFARAEFEQAWTEYKKQSK